MKTSEDIKEIASALNQMQKVMQNASKDQKGYGYNYSDLAGVWSVIREPLTDNGLCVVQDAQTDEHGVNVTTTVFHTSGQWMEFGPLTIPMGKRDAHSTGSAATYGKRYGLCAALGVVTEDDDGQAAQAHAPKQQKPQKKALRKATEEEVSRFNTYCDEKLAGYGDWIDRFIEGKASYMRVEKEQVIWDCLQDLKKFETQLNQWIEKKRKEIESE